MSQEEKKSLFAPVGKAQKFRSMNGEVTMTLAIFDASQVPEGSDLYVQPKDSRLKLEIEVANDNALHWKNALGLANERNRQQRKENRDLRTFMQDLLDSGVISCGDRRKKAREILKED